MALVATFRVPDPPRAAPRESTNSARCSSPSFARPLADAKAARVSSLTSQRKPQRTLDGDAHEPERLVGEDLHPVALGEVAVEPGDLGDLVGRDLLALLAQALAHLHEQLAGVDELHLAAPFGALAVGDDPEVGRDAGVVEELIGQRDDGFEPVVLDDPAADLRLTRTGRAGEERRAVEDDRQP